MSIREDKERDARFRAELDAWAARSRAELDERGKRFRGELNVRGELDERSRDELIALDKRLRAELDERSREESVALDKWLRGELYALDALDELDALDDPRKLYEWLREQRGVGEWFREERAAWSAWPGRSAKALDELDELDKLDELDARFRAELDELDARSRVAMAARSRAELDAQSRVAVATRVEQIEQVKGQQTRPAARPINEETLRLRAERAARVWSHFGLVLPAHSREKFLGPDLAEHTADFFAALAEAEAPGRQNLLIVYYTIVAIAKVIDCAWVTAQRRLRDEFDWVVGRLTQK